MKTHFLAGLLCYLLTGTAVGANAHFQSGPGAVAVIELFTSEGCSSCPPADAWLNHLQKAPGLWQRFIPIAFHVDYWDALGWIDPFENAAFSARQRAYRTNGKLSAVYTPAIMFQGREFRSWWRYTSPPDIALPLVGTLKVQVEGHRIAATFSPSTPSSRPLRATAALLGFGLTSQVPNGENAGRTLHHDFVNLGQSTQIATPQHNRYQWQLSLPTPKVKTASRLGIVVWVSLENQETPIQATGGYLMPQ